MNGTFMRSGTLSARGSCRSPSYPNQVVKEGCFVSFTLCISATPPSFLSHLRFKHCHIYGKSGRGVVQAIVFGVYIVAKHSGADGHSLALKVLANDYDGRARRADVFWAPAWISPNLANIDNLA